MASNTSNTPTYEIRAVHTTCIMWLLEKIFFFFSCCNQFSTRVTYRIESVWQPEAYRINMADINRVTVSTVLWMCPDGLIYPSGNRLTDERFFSGDTRMFLSILQCPRGTKERGQDVWTNKTVLWQIAL